MGFNSAFKGLISLITCVISLGFQNMKENVTRDPLF